jgi:hypothetical protein
MNKIRQIIFKNGYTLVHAAIDGILVALLINFITKFF